MGRGLRLAAVVATVAFLLPATGSAQILYAASLRSFANAGSQIVVGNLFTVDLATGVSTLVAPIRLDGHTAVGITGLAVHPAAGTFYGITSPLSPEHPLSLVRIDPTNGHASLIGKLSEVGSDIAFDASGTLYIWLPQSRQIGMVNVANGTVTPLGSPGPPSTSGGLAIDSKGVAYITPNGATGTLDIVDIRTGVVKTGPQLAGAPFAAAINAMTFLPTGALVAVNSNAGVPQTTQLVSINTGSGVVVAVSLLPDDTDALTFAPKPPFDPIAAMKGLRGRELALLVFSSACLVAFLGFLMWVRRRRARN